MSGLIWIQAVWHSDGILERFFFFEKVNLKKKKKKKKSIDNKKKACKITQDAKR